MARFARIAALAAIATPLFFAATSARAEPVKFEALVAEKESSRLDFADGSKRFFLLVRREGRSEGQGPLAGATVQEYGAHDVLPGVSGEAHGYLVFATADGGAAYLKWLLHAVFVPGAEGKPKLLNSGVWEVAGATGALETLRGAGRFHLQFPGRTERLFVLEGELVQ